MPTTNDIESQRMLLGTTPVRKIYQGQNLIGMRIAELFANGEQGVWYDPSDFSTLFQDAAGTVPVTAVEQPVGLMLDKSKGLGPELVTNGTFDTDINGWIVSPKLSSSTAVEWSNGALHVYNTQDNYGESRSAAIPLTIGKQYVLEMDILEGTTDKYWIIIGSSASNDNDGRITVTSESSGTSPSGYKRWRYSFVASYATAYLYFATNQLAGSHLYADNISVRELPGNHASQPTATSRPVLSARVNQYLATETLATQNVTTLEAQYRLSFEGTGTVTLSGTATGVYSAGSHLITCTAGTLTSTVSGLVTKADLRVANTGAGLPAYQRVNTATDYDTVGFPHYLKCDGVDDGMVTNSIDFTYTNTMTLVAGLRNLTDTIAIPVELSSNYNNPGSMYLSSGADPSNGYRALSRGSLEASYGQGSWWLGSAPDTSVLAASHNIPGDNTTLRRNGVAQTPGTLDKGSGNFGNYPLYLFRRGGTTLPFNGQFYGLVIVGKLLSDSQLTSTEKYINTKTRAY